MCVGVWRVCVGFVGSVKVCMGSVRMCGCVRVCGVCEGVWGVRM